MWFTHQVAVAVHLAAVEGEGLVVGSLQRLEAEKAGNPRHLEEGRELADSPAEAVESQEVEPPSQIPTIVSSSAEQTRIRSR